MKRDLTVKEIFKLLRKGAIVNILNESKDDALEEPVYTVEEESSESSFVDIDDLNVLNPQKQIDDLRNILHTSLMKKKHGPLKVFYVKVSPFSEPLITREYK